MKAALLPDRGVVKVAGAEARKFLNGLITSDLDKISPERAGFAALLTPQGKIIADFIIAEARSTPLPSLPHLRGEAGEGAGGFFLDCQRSLASTLVQRLKFYKLRAQVTIDDLSSELSVLAIWDGARSTSHGLCYRDPRSPEAGLRAVLAPHLAGAVAADLGAELVEPAAYEAHRIALALPRGGLDFRYGDAFPHEADMDQLDGIDFDKGCFVGQEVVSRIEHRGTARSRIVPVAFDGPAPEPGTPVVAGERTVGTFGSATAGRGLAMLRLDRVAEALAAGQALVAGNCELQVLKPVWARFSFPTAAKVAE